jgi:hypothetical protein
MKGKLYLKKSERRFPQHKPVSLTPPYSLLLCF